MTRLGDDAMISYGLLCEPNSSVSRSTSELRMKLVLLNMLKPSSNSLPTVSFVDPFLLFTFSCLSLLCCFVCSLQPCGHLLGNGLTSWLSCV